MGFRSTAAGICFGVLVLGSPVAGASEGDLTITVDLSRGGAGQRHVVMVNRLGSRSTVAVPGEPEISVLTSTAADGLIGSKLRITEFPSPDNKRSLTVDVSSKPGETVRLFLGKDPESRWDVVLRVASADETPPK